MPEMLGITESLTAGLWVIRNGILTASRRGFCKLHIESNSSTAIQILTKAINPTHRLYTFILGCMELSQQFDLVEFLHVVKRMLYVRK
ncbi:hypothetical protein SLA2020_058810 [Shorea laevis]